jgi:zinc protease
MRRSPPGASRPSLLPLLLLSMVAPAVPAAARTLDAASIREKVLPSGLRVVVRESHAAGLVSIQYWVRAGVFREDEKSAGTAHFIEHLLFKGTETRPQGAIDAEIEDLGGVLEAETDKDWTTFRVAVATPFWTKALAILADTVQHPRFRLEDMEAERRVILNEIAAGRAEPLRVLMNSLYQHAMPDSPYRFPTTGTPEQVIDLKLGPLRDYFRKHYTPANSVLIVVGDVIPDQVFQQATTLFKPATGDGRPQASAPAIEIAGYTDEVRLRGLTTQSAQADFVPLVARGFNRRERAGPRLTADAQPAPSPRRHVLPSPFRSAFYGVAFPAPGVREVPDVYAMDVIVTMLQHGRTGRLPARLEPIVRAVQADYQTLRAPGILTVMAAVAPERLDEVEKAVLAEIGKLRAAPPPGAEVQATQSILAGAYAMDNETFAGQGKALGYYAMIDRWQFASTYLDEIAKVTPAQVHAAALKYLDPDRAVTVILQPAGEEPQS